MKVINLSEVKEQRKNKEENEIKMVEPITYHFYNNASSLIEELSKKIDVDEKKFMEITLYVMKKLITAQENGSEICIINTKRENFFITKRQEEVIKFKGIKEKPAEVKTFSLKKMMSRLKFFINK